VKDEGRRQEPEGKTQNRGGKWPGVFHSALCLLIFALSAALAAELNFSAEVDRNSVGLGEQLQLTVTVSGTNIGGVPRPQLPSLPDFNNLGSTSSQSTNISFVNGRMTQEQTVSFIYVLSPKRVGDLVIGPCKLDFKGTTYQTQPINIAVTKESQAPPPQPRAQPRQPQSPFGWDPFAQPRQQRSAPRGAVHLLASADRTSVYQGEQVNVTYTFYTQAQIGNLSMKDVPGFTGFWVEKLYDAKELNYKQTTYGGQQYNAATLKQAALFPTQPGDLKVDKMTLAGDMVVSGGFFFDATQPFEVSSDPITIHVKPLPDAGRPADFSGGVGDFRLSASLSKDSSVGGEPLTLTLTVTGSGNTGLIGEPKLPVVSGVKVLQPEARQNTNSSAGRISGTRLFSFPLIPTADGKYVVPEIGMSFFNPKTASYYSQTTPRLEFVATGATGKTPLSESELGVKVLGSDIAHIKPALSALAARSSRSSWVWVFYPLGLVVLGAGVVMGRHQRRLEQDRGYARRTRSSRLVRKRLAEAEALLKQGREGEFYAALSRAVLGYAGDRFNIEVSGMTGDEIRTELDRRGVEAAVVTRLLDLASQCDAARFSPGMRTCSPRETLDLARGILEKL